MCGEDCAHALDSLNLEQHKKQLEEKLPYYHKRVELFEKYYEREVERKKAAEERAESITITLPDGTQKEVRSLHIWIDD